MSSARAPPLVVLEEIVTLLKWFFYLVGIVWLFEDRHFLIIFDIIENVFESFWYVLTGGPISEMPERYIEYLKLNHLAFIIPLITGVMWKLGHAKDFAEGICAISLATILFGPFGFAAGIVYVIYRSLKWFVGLFKSKPETKKK